MTDQERLMLTQHALALVQFLQTFFTCQVSTDYRFLGNDSNPEFEPRSPIYWAAKAELQAICNRLWP